MKHLLAGWIAVMAALTSAEPLRAHHSLANFDTTTPIRLKGTIVRFHEINPHSFLYLEVPDEKGQIQRWAVEGPSISQLARRSFATDALKPGTVIEVCGYAPKEPTIWQIASTAPGTVSLAGRLLDAEMLVLRWKGAELGRLRRAQMFFARIPRCALEVTPGWISWIVG